MIIAHSKLNYAKAILVSYSEIGYSENFNSQGVHPVHLPKILLQICMEFAAGEDIIFDSKTKPPIKATLMPFARSMYPNKSNTDPVFEFAVGVKNDASKDVKIIFGHDEDMRLLHSHLITMSFLNVYHCIQPPTRDNRYEISFLKNAAA